ncbi:putative N-acetyltransferase YjaB [compost metagenome]
MLGFYALHGDTLAAIFVSPLHQGRGIGKILIEHAVQQRGTLSLNVYKENAQSISFYLKYGFECMDEQVDPNTGHKEISMRKSI